MNPSTTFLLMYDKFVSFLGTLTLIFITLRLTNFIDWSWWWVLSPIWVPIALSLLLGVVVVMISNAEKRRMIKLMNQSGSSN